MEQSIARRYLHVSGRRQSYTLKSGVTAGGVPETTNPGRVLRDRIEDGMKFVTARVAWDSLHNNLDLRLYVRQGERPPVGFDKRTDPAQLAGLSQSQFARAFKASTGLPPYKWRLHNRIKRTQEMLLNSNNSLSEIALHYGFADQSHFTKA